MKKLYGIALILLMVISINAQTLYNYPNLLNYSHFPKGTNDTIEDCFTSNGAWFGLGLPTDDEPDRYGRLAGPFSLYQNSWIAKALLHFNLGIVGIGKIQLESAKEHEIIQYPGLLVQRYIFESFKIEQRLVFISGRTCLMKVDAINTSAVDIPMTMMMKGNTYEGLGEADDFTDGWMYNIDGTNDVFWLLRFRLDENMNLVMNNDSYEFSYKEPVFVHPGDTLSLVATLSQYFKGDSRKDVETASKALNDPDTFFNQNEKLWRYLINNIVPEEKELREISVKALQTMYLNLRSFLPSFKNYFFVEHSGLHETYINTDEAWFYASSFIRYDSRLAKNILASVISNINDDKSINSIIPVLNYSDSTFVINEKPMAAWTAWNIFSSDTENDTVLMETVYGIVKDYHNYWYENNNRDNNLWCEDGNGVERADLNAMLFTEKYCLSKLADKLGYKEDVKEYRQQMDSIKYYYSQHFFDVQLLSFVNFNLTDNSMELDTLAIGYALWSGLAAFDIADYYAYDIRLKMQDSTYHNLFANGNYDIEDYYYLISGLKLYNYKELSDSLNTVLLNQVLLDSENKPIPSYGMNGKQNNNSTLTSAILLLLINY